MSARQQPFATLGNLERLGIATKAIQALPVLTRRDAIKVASGLLEPFILKRHRAPFLVEHDPDFDDLSGMTGGAVPIWSLAAVGPVAPGGQARPADVLVSFPAGGTVGIPGITYNVTGPDAGAFGITTGPTQPFPTSGVVTLFGYPFQLPLGATVAPGDACFFCLRTDAGLTGAALMLAAHRLVSARGVDPVSLQTLKEGKDEAYAWARALEDGSADLAKGTDAAPTIQTGGVRFNATRAQKSAYGWVSSRGYDSMGYGR